MKKVFGISLLVLVVLLFGVLPGVMGMMAERATTAVMRAPVPNNYPVTFQLVSYQRHWFTSDVVYTVTAKSWAVMPSQTQNTAVPTGITVTEKVYHGPIVITRDLMQAWHIYIGQALGKGLITPNPAGTSFQNFFPQMTLSAQGNFQSLTTLGLFGHLRIDVLAPALTLSSKTTNDVIKLSPINVYASADRNMKRFGFGLSVPAMNVLNQGKLVFTMNRWDLQAKLHKSPEQLLLGWANLQIANTTATAMGGRHFELQNLVLNAKSDIRAKLLDSDSQVSFSRFTMNDKQFGPGVAKLSFKRFDPKAQAELARLNKYEAPQTPWAQAAMMREASRLFSKLIAHGAEIIVSPVNVKTTDGDVNLGLSIAFPNVKGNRTSLPMQLRNTNANFKLDLPKALANRLIEATNRRQIELQMGAELTPNGSTNIDAMVTAQRTQQVNNWLSRGFVISHGDNYALDLSYKQGSAYLNGKDFRQVFAAPTNAMTATAVGQSNAPTVAVVSSAVPATTTVAPAAPTGQAPVSPAPAVNATTAVPTANTLPATPAANVGTTMPAAPPAPTAAPVTQPTAVTSVPSVSAATAVNSTPQTAGGVSTPTGN